MTARYGLRGKLILGLVMLPLLPIVLILVLPFITIVKPFRDRRTTRKAQVFRDECVGLGWQCRITASRHNVANYAVEGGTGGFEWSCQFYPNPQDSTSAVIPFVAGPLARWTFDDRVLEGWIFIQPRSHWNSWSSQTIRSSRGRSATLPGWLGAYARASEIRAGAAHFHDRFVVASDADAGLVKRIFASADSEALWLALDPSLAEHVHMRIGEGRISIEHPHTHAYRTSVLEQLVAIGVSVRSRLS